MVAVYVHLMSGANGLLQQVELQNVTFSLCTLKRMYWFVMMQDPPQPSLTGTDFDVRALVMYAVLAMLITWRVDGLVEAARVLLDVLHTHASRCRFLKQRHCRTIGTNFPQFTDNHSWA